MCQLHLKCRPATVLSIPPPPLMLPLTLPLSPPMLLRSPQLMPLLPPNVAATIAIKTTIRRVRRHCNTTANVAITTTTVAASASAAVTAADI